MAPRKYIANTIWNYFENQSDIEKAVCTLCHLQLKNNRNYNLKTHLFKIHNIDLNNIESSTSSSSHSPVTRLQNHNSPMQKLQAAKTTISTATTANSYIKVQIKKKTLFRSFIGLVTEDSVPFDVLNSANFKNIIDPICEGLGEQLGKSISLNAGNCKTNLKTIAVNIRDNMTMEMSHRLLSLKIDSTTRLSDKILGISAQFLQDDEIKSLLLAIVQLKGIGESASNNLAAEVVKTLKNYDIQLKRIVSITTINEAITMKTCEILSNYQEDLNNIDNLANPSNVPLPEKHIQICKCAAHTAQLCALDIATDPEIKGFLQSCRNFTKFICETSNGFKEAFELSGGHKLPQLDCPAIWGSTYEMLQTLQAAKHLLLSVKSIGNKTINENFENNSSLWEFIECYVTVVAPLQDSLVKFQTEHLHYGNFYAQWLKCKILTSKIIENHDTKDVMKKIGNKILESMEKHASHLLDNESLNACLFLDPRFHHTLSGEKRQEAISYLKNLWEKKLSVSPSSLSEYSSEDNVLMSYKGGTFKDEAEEMLNSFLTEKLQATSREIVHSDAYSKIVNLHLPFMRSDTDVLQFWRERKHSDPELYALSNICFGIPPTQVIMDPVSFSSLSLNLKDNSNQMNHETLEDMLLVKLNSSLLDEAIENLPLFEDEISEELLTPKIEPM